MQSAELSGVFAKLDEIKTEMKEDYKTFADGVLNKADATAAKRTGQNLGVLGGIAVALAMSGAALAGVDCSSEDGAISDTDTDTDTDGSSEGTGTGGR